MMIDTQTTTLLLAQSESKLQEARTAFFDSNKEKSEQLAREVITSIENFLNLKAEEHHDSESENRHSLIRCLAHAYNRIGSIAYTQRRFDDAINAATTSLALAEQVSDSVRITNVNATLGDAYLGKSDYTTALNYYSTALNGALATKDKVLAAMIMRHMGIAHKELTEYATALEYFHRAKEIKEELGDTNGLGGMIINIAIVHQAFGDYNRALESFTLALQMFQELGDRTGIAFALSSIGGLYFRLEDYEHALSFYSQALSAQLEIGEKRDANVARGNLGHVYMNLGEYDLAHEYLSQSLAESIAINAVYPQLHWLNGLGELYSQKAYSGFSPDIAERYLHEAVEISKVHGIRNITSVAYQSLDTLYKRIGNWEKAYSARDEYEKIKQDINLEGAQRKAAEQEKVREIAEKEKQLAIQKAKHEATEQLLHNVLPPAIAQRMIAGENLIAEKLSNVSVLFADIVDFTQLSQSISAEELVEGLDRIFSAFDVLAENYGLEKIKTIGDAYMVVAGAPDPRTDHAHVMAKMAIDMQKAIREFTSIATGQEIQIRIGIHSGDVVAGVIGKKKFAYDLWGDAVNTAARMESFGEAGRIHISEEFVSHLTQTLSQVKDITSLSFTLGEGWDGVIIPRGEIDIKGKGIMKTYFLECSDGNG